MPITAKSFIEPVGPVPSIIRSWIPYLSMSALILAVAGCFPDNVVWLPDSTAVVYTDKGASRLVRYDLAKKTSKVIKATDTNTPWPGLSRDGKRLAVAKCDHSWKKGEKVSTWRTQIIIYDIDGTEQKRSSIHAASKEYKNPHDSSATNVEPTALNWSGPPEKILVVCGPGEASAIYDVVLDKWVSLADKKMLPSAFNNQPVRPDGKGFLALSERGLFVFVDWDGRVSKFKDVPEKLDDKGIAFAWDKNTAIMTSVDGLHKFDTAAMKYSFAPEPSRLPREGELTWIQRFPGTDLQLRAFVKDTKGVKSVTRLDAVNPAKEIRRTLVVAETHMANRSTSLGNLSFFPSPNGDKVAIRFRLNGRETILIVDKAGDTLATILPE